MNTRTIGKLFIGIGIIMLLAYVGWVVFRVVRQPEQVQQLGLLPNPFDIIIPGRKPVTDGGPVTGTVVPTGDVTVIDTPIEPDKRLFRVSQYPALAFSVSQSDTSVSEVDPVTGKTETVTVPETKVRYVTRDEGFVVDAVISTDSIAETRVSNAFFSGLYQASVGKYAATGQYRLPDSSTTTTYVLPLDPLPKELKTKPVYKPECSYTLTAASLGQQGRNIEYLQQVLIAAGFARGYVVGVYDDVMMAAVVDYQKAAVITPSSGVIGPKTLSRIQSDCIRLLPKKEPVLTFNELSERDQSRVTVLPRGVYWAGLVDDTHIVMMLNSGGKNRIVIRDISNGRDAELYSLGFIDWVPQVLNNAALLLTTTASGSVPGYAFTLSRQGGSLLPILQGISGLSTVASPDGKHILYSSTEGGLPTLSLYNIASRTSTAVPMQTFAEKCTWNDLSTVIFCFVPNGLDDNAIYPDEWYKRGVDIVDDLQVYTLGQGTVTSPDQVGEIQTARLDVIEAHVSSNQSVIIFQDWKSGYIWGYRLQ